MTVSIAARDGEVFGVAVASKVLAVGSNDEIKKLKGGKTQVIDLGGHFVMPGFNDAHLHLAALPPADDPLHGRIVASAPAGLLGIDLATRRRNRANGTVEARDGAGFTVAVRESFGNCPRYIHVRRLVPVVREQGTALAFEGALPDAARRLLAGTPTLFVASRSGAGTLDISHRGGPPGFVQVGDDPEGSVLAIPDYAGNRYYNTLGNFVADPRAAIVLFDPASGDMLHLQGRVRIDWDGADPDQDPPAERTWRFEAVRGVLRPGAFGLADA